MGTDEPPTTSCHPLPPCNPPGLAGGRAQTLWGEDGGLGEGVESQKLSIAGDFTAVAKVSRVPAPSSAVTAEVELTADPSICIS